MPSVWESYFRRSIFLASHTWVGYHSGSYQRVNADFVPYRSGCVIANPVWKKCSRHRRGRILLCLLSNRSGGAITLGLFCVGLVLAPRRAEAASFECLN